VADAIDFRAAGKTAPGSFGKRAFARRIGRFRRKIFRPAGGRRLTPPVRVPPPRAGRCYAAMIGL
jgi:hypothetical protein